MTIDQIREETQLLDDSEKGILAGELLAEMEPSSRWTTDAEVHERVRELESGEVEDIGLGELKRRLGKN